MPFVSGPTATLVESSNVTCVHRTTIAECEAAATQLGLSDTSATLDGEMEISGPKFYVHTEGLNETLLRQKVNLSILKIK